MSTTSDLAAVLEAVTRPGDFVTSGTFELLPPSISVQGVGPIALPLLPEQARALVAVAEQAPYGKGPETLVDTAVRRTWQIEPDRVRIARQALAGDARRPAGPDRRRPGRSAIRSKRNSTSC